MSNKFAIVLAKLNEAIDSGVGLDLTANANPDSSWDSTKMILRKTPDGLVAYVKGIYLYDFISASDERLLKESDLALDDGNAVRVKLNGKEIRDGFGIRYSQLKEMADETEKETSEVSRLKAEKKDLQLEVKTLRDMLASSDTANSFYSELSERVKIEMASVKTSKTRRKPSNKSLGGVPVLLCSDWHWGEVVRPEEVMHVNAFNMDIANSRADRVFDKTLEILTTHMSGQHYEGMVLALGGDMVSGNIHEELRETNEKGIMEVMMALALKLREKILMVSKEFPDVMIPCVSGNHGRLSQKWRAKGKQKDNFDFMVYTMLQDMFRDTPNVRFVIPEATDVPFSTYHVNYLLTHGDQFKVGSSENVLSAIKKADYQKKKLHQASGSYDYLVCGHFHTYIVGEGVIVNGSLKGTDEFSFQHNFEHEPARQALWIAHPDYGITNHLAIYGDEPESDGTEYPPMSTPNLQNVVRMFK